MNIVLLEPEIPQNTGNIGRTCVATETSLHLIRPLGFDITEKAVKRAGLDYWKALDLKLYDNFEHFLNENPGIQLFMATTKARKTYADVCYNKDSFIMFGKESAGIPENILIEHKESCIRIPMLSECRSLNLSNSAAIILYEALRQNGFDNLLKEGELHHGHW